MPIIDIPITGGIDTRSDPKTVDPPRLLDVENGVYTANGGLQKRPGQERLNTTTTASGVNIDAGTGLAVRDNTELCMFDDVNLYSYDTVGQRWVDKGDCTVVNTTEAGVSVRQSNQTVPDLCSHQGITVYAWYDSDGSRVMYNIRSNATGMYYAQEVGISGSTKPRLVPAGNAILLFYCVAATPALRCKVILPGNAWATPNDVEIVGTTFDNNCVYDADISFDGQAAIVAYRASTAGADTITACYVLPNGQVAPTTENTNYPTIPAVFEATDSDATVTAIAVASNSQYVFCAWLRTAATAKLSYTVANARTLVMATTGAAAIESTADAATTSKRITLIPATDGSTTCTLAMDDESASESYGDAIFIYSPSLSAIGSGAEYQSVTLAAHGFYRDRVHLVVANDSILQSSVWLVTPGAVANAWTPLARNLYGTGHGRPSGVHMPKCYMVDGDPDTRTVAAIHRRKLLTAADASDDTRSEFFERKTIRQLTYAFPATGRYQHVTAGKTLYLAGGVGWQYDGQTVCEQAPLLFPESHTLASSNGAGALTNSGQYNYRVYYEYTNVHGERVRSSALTKTITLGASDDTVTITLPAHGISAAAYVDGSGDSVNGVYAVVYRTVANADLTQGAFFYRVSSSDPSVGGAANGWVRPPLTGTTAYVDYLSDAAIVEFEVDPLSISETDYDALPASTMITEGNGRVYATGLAHNPNAVIASKLRANEEACQFSLYNEIEAPDDGGPVTGIAPLGANLAIFKRDRIYLLSGDGPSNTGQGGYATPQLVTFDVGCVNHRSIAPFPGGVLFQSHKGIRAIGPDFAVVDVGAAVDGYVRGADGLAAVNITGAITLVDRNEIRFITESGRTLVFNYGNGAWTTFTGVNGVASVVWLGKQVTLDASGRVHVETPDAYTDAGGNYRLRVKLPWLRFAGAQGRQRIRRIELLGTYHSAHSLKVKNRYDYATPADAGLFATSDVIDVDTYGAGDYGDDYYGGGTAGDSVYRITHRPARQRCTAYQLEIYDQPGTPGRAYEISALSIDVDAESGPAKLQSNRNFSASGPSTE
jgi:hypothetical protein